MLSNNHPQVFSNKLFTTKPLHLSLPFVVIALAEIAAIAIFVSVGSLRLNSNKNALRFEDGFDGVEHKTCYRETGRRKMFYYLLFQCAH